ncbi:MAG: hypothetical protein KF784_11130 [Fimbriimonadaceae bacterium]|nr:hypothetical protein [Fimbriimonadaceae bacterium]
MTIWTAVAAIFTFSGGSPSEFANQLFEESKQPVMVSQAVSVRLPAMEFDATDVNSIYAAFRSSPTMTKTPGVEMTYTDGMIPPEVLGLNLRLPGSYSARTARLDADAVNDGKITIQLKENEVIRVEDLANLELSRPLRIHPVLGNLQLAIRVEEMEEREFLIKVAKLIGGHLLSTEQQLTIMPYVAEFGKRAETTLRTSVRDINPNGNELMLQGVEARIAMIREMNPQELLHALDGSVRTEFWISTKQRTASVFVRWVQMAMQEAQTSGRRSRTRIVDLRYVDWQRSTFRVDSRLNLSAELVLVDPVSRRENEVRYTVTQSRTSRRGRG